MYTDYFMKEGHVPWQWNKLPDFQREAYIQQAKGKLKHIICKKKCN